MEDCSEDVKLDNEIANHANVPHVLVTLIVTFGQTKFAKITYVGTDMTQLSILSLNEFMNGDKDSAQGKYFSNNLILVFSPS